MIASVRRDTANIPPPSQGQGSRSAGQGSHGASSDAAKRPQGSLTERVRTFFDRTLDAAFGRFDH
jgi:hypothetical protein